MCMYKEWKFNVRFVIRWWVDLFFLLNYFDVFVGELNELVCEKDFLVLEKKCEYYVIEIVMNNVCEM